MPKAVLKHSFSLVCFFFCYLIFWHLLPRRSFLCAWYLCLSLWWFWSGNWGDTGAAPKNSERGGHDTCQLYRYFFFYWEFMKNCRKSHRKRGGHGAPLVPPLNPYSFKLEQNKSSDHCYSTAGARATSCNISGCYWLYWSCNRTHAGSQSGTSVPWATPSSPSSKTCFLWHNLKIKCREEITDKYTI